MTAIHMRRMFGALVMGALAASTAGAAARGPAKMLTTGRFRVEFPGIEEFAPIEVRGLVSESGFVVSSRKPAPEPARDLKPVKIVIVRRAQKPDALWQWRVAIMSGRRDHRTGRIYVLDADNEPALSFVILNAFPYKWVWPDLNAVKPELAVEEIHLIAQAVLPADTPLPKSKSNSKTKAKALRPGKPMLRMRTGR